MGRHTPTIRRGQRAGALLGVLLISSLALLSSPVGVSRAQEAGPLTPTAAPAPGTRPDMCEPNDSLVAPCALQTEVDLADLNFVDGTPDVYSFLFKGGRVYAIEASSAAGVDPAIRVFVAGQTEQPVAENDDAAPGSADAAVQIPVTGDGWYIVEVTNRAPGNMRGKAYTLSARSSAPPQTTATSTTQTRDQAGDILENNYDLAHASRIGWGVPYDLSLACPDPRPDACYAGDHDFLLLPVKRGVPLIALTYDLGPGADTALTLYRPDVAQADGGPGNIPGWSAVAGNDDIAPGRTLRSQLLLTPNWDGQALLVVAESERRTPPAVPEALGPAGRYRLMVGSPGMEALQTVLNAQSDLEPSEAPTNARPSTEDAEQPAAPRSTSEPAAQVAPAATPTPAPVSVAAPAPGSATEDAEEIIKETCTAGLAKVDRGEAAFYSAANPASERRLLTTYPKDTRVTLLGSCYIGWVKVQPESSVTPGWMFAPDLLLLESSGPAVETDAIAPAQPAGGNTGITTPTAPVAAAKVRVVRIAATPAPAPTALQRQALAVALRVVDREGRGVAGVKVELVNVFGQVLIDAVTPANGGITFTPDLAPNTAVRVQIPAAGLSAPVDPANPNLVITLPQGGV